MRYILCLYGLLCALHTITMTNAFFSPPRYIRRRKGSSSSSSGSNSDIPSQSSLNANDSPSLSSFPLYMNHTFESQDDLQENAKHLSPRTLVARGKRTTRFTTTNNNKRNNRQSSTKSSTAQSWINNLTSSLTRPFHKINHHRQRFFRSKQQKEKDDMMHTLLTTPIRQVVIKPSTTVLPETVVHIAARRAGLLGQPLHMDRVSELAQALHKWYQRQGYVLHSVTGATLLAETGTAEIQVQEPVLSTDPVSIVFCHERVVDPDTGDHLTLRQYTEKQQQHNNKRPARNNNNRPDTTVTRNDLNFTYIPTPTGRTRPRRIAAALELLPGQQFRWNEQRWRKIVKSGIFQKVIQAVPQTVSDGTIQLQMVVQEAPPRHLEYGLSKSLYTGDWEGELDFEHVNVLGGGESLGFTVRRGTKGPSGRLRFSDDRFGLEGGYDVELFSDFIGDNDDNKAAVTKESLQKELVKGAKELVRPSPRSLLDHRSGATFRLRNPIHRKYVLNSVATASLEHVTTAEGLHENIVSTSLGVGPFVRQLPRGARSNVDARLMIGSRFFGKIPSFMRNKNVENELDLQQSIAPYSSFTATTRQVFPVLSGYQQRPVILALRHSLITSTHRLPQHEGRAQGLSCSIRGAGDIRSVSSAITGTTEIRVPIPLPLVDSSQQDASIVLFGDWLFGKESSSSVYFRKSSIGLGIRKSVQGIPLKVNISYLRGEGKIKSSFGLGSDFEI